MTQKHKLKKKELAMYFHPGIRKYALVYFHMNGIIRPKVIVLKGTFSTTWDFQLWLEKFKEKILAYQRLSHPEATPARIELMEANWKLPSSWFSWEAYDGHNIDPEKFISMAVPS